MVKNLSIYITIGTLLVGIIGSWIKMETWAQQSKSNIEELKIDVKTITADSANEINSIKDKQVELDKAVDKTQIKQEVIEKKVEEVSEKTDKVIALLLEMRQQSAPTTIIVPQKK